MPTNPDDDDFTTKTSLFTTWLSKNAIYISPKISIHDYRSTTNQGRGIIALEDIPENEPLFKIPRSAVLNISNNSLMKEYPVDEYPEMWDRLMELDQWTGLIIVLWYEFSIHDKEGGSKWGDYLNVLPFKDDKDFNQLVFWNEEEIKGLRPSYVVERIGMEKNRELFEDVCKVVKELKIKELVDELSFEKFNKVASLIMSYSFDVEKVFHKEEQQEENDDEDDEEEEEVEYLKSMVPLADTLNANTHLNNAILTYPQKDNPDNHLTMVSIKNITKGDQIYNIYSNHSNSELLRRYGYVETTGSNYETEKLDIVLGMIDDEYKASNEEEEDIEDGILLDTFDVFDTGDVSLELVFLIQILTILNTSGSDDDSQTFIHRVFVKIYQLIESGRVTSNFIDNFKDILKLRLNEYPESSKDDFKEYTGDMTRSDMAEVLLKSEYKAIKKCQDSIQDKYKVIPDDKLIKNILKNDKKRQNDDKSTTSKKSKQK
ncbi:RKM4 Ribosomal lysine N-methyltransferase 4 [Candida maltosa Xu316]